MAAQAESGQSPRDLEQSAVAGFPKLCVRERTERSLMGNKGRAEMQDNKTPPTDEELVRRTRAGDGDAARLLFTQRVESLRGCPIVLIAARY